MSAPRSRLERCRALVATWVAAAATALVVLTSVPAAAETQTVVRSRMPDGTTTYGDTPAAGATSTRRIEVEPHPGDPEAAARSLSDLERNRQRLLTEHAEHEARRAQVDADLGQAAERLRQAKMRREAGRAVIDGDRQGRRLGPDYWARQAALDAQLQAEADALARLRRERSSLEH